MKALENAQAGLVSYNLGTGNPVSVRELVASFEKAVGKELPKSVKPRREGDLAATYCTPAKAERELGWKATRTIDDMTRDVWNWQQNNPGGYEG